MKFDTDWRALGKHRIRLRSAKGFLTEVMHQLAEVTRTTVDNNMSARARVVDIVFRQEKTYHIAVGSTVRRTGSARRNGSPLSQRRRALCPIRSI